MEDVIEQIPPEAWPLIDLLFNLTMAATGIWLAITVFVLWRRNASNLTSVSSASRNKDINPDFLSVDEKARQAAIKRGDDFGKVLDERDRQAHKEELRAKKRDMSLFGTISRLVSLGMALFSIATVISGTMFQVTIMGRYWEQYSAGERLMSVVQSHPFGVTVTVLVIVYNVYHLITKHMSKES